MGWLVGGGLDPGVEEWGPAVFFAMGLGWPTALTEVSVGPAVFWSAVTSALTAFTAVL